MKGTCVCLQQYFQLVYFSFLHIKPRTLMNVRKEEKENVLFNPLNLP